MLAYFNQIDTRLFFFFNVHLANPLFDILMPFITDKYTWLPVWIAAIVLLLWKGGKKGKAVLILVLLSVVLTDVSVNRLLKPLIHRVRPCNVLQGLHLLVHRSGSFSMPSSHAANFFTLATIFSAYYKRYQWIFWLSAALVAYSRVAVGVHYPFDILVGALVGWIDAQIVLLLLSRSSLKKFNPRG